MRALQVGTHGRADQDGTPGAGLDQADAAQDERPHDPLAEFGLGDQHGPQPIGGDEERLDGADGTSVHEGGAPRQLTHLGKEPAEPQLDDREDMPETLPPGDSNRTGEDDEHPGADVPRGVQ